jgi:hypothetical protein
MSWVVRFKGLFTKGVIRQSIIASMAVITTFISLAKAATFDAFNPLDSGIRPMYGIAVPIAKYGPQPTTPVLINPGQPSFDWQNIWTPPWSSGRSPFQFTTPDLGHWFPSFPKLMGIMTSDLLTIVGVIAYITLIMWAVCGWTVSGAAWYVGAKYKKK